MSKWAEAFTASVASVDLAGPNTRRSEERLGHVQGSRQQGRDAPDPGRHCQQATAGEGRKPSPSRCWPLFGVRRDGQKVLPSAGNMGEGAQRQCIEDVDARGLKQPALVIMDGSPDLEAALAPSGVKTLPRSRCTAHKHRNLLAHAPMPMHEEWRADARDMIHAPGAAEVQKHGTAFLGKHLRDTTWMEPSRDILYPSQQWLS